MRSHEQTSRRVADGGRQRAGSRGAHAIHRTEIIRMPSGSIAQIPALESPDLSHSGINKPLLFALAINVLCWGFILLAGRALAAVFL
jgi:hypothetical protein